MGDIVKYLVGGFGGAGLTVLKLNKKNNKLPNINS